MAKKEVVMETAIIFWPIPIVSTRSSWISSHRHVQVSIIIRKPLLPQRVQWIMNPTCRTQECLVSSPLAGEVTRMQERGVRLENMAAALSQVNQCLKIPDISSWFSS
ncbi:hypothetical protein R3I94_015728 [Phoxinus phoxinus]